VNDFGVNSNKEKYLLGSREEGQMELVGKSNVPGFFICTSTLLFKRANPGVAQPPHVQCIPIQLKVPNFALHLGHGI
jgi:hypothetical protein